VGFLGRIRLQSAAVQALVSSPAVRFWIVAWKGFMLLARQKESCSCNNGKIGLENFPVWSESKISSNGMSAMVTHHGTVRWFCGSGTTEIKDVGNVEDRCIGD
jgi:hypothetical protein